MLRTRPTILGIALSTMMSVVACCMSSRPSGVRNEGASTPVATVATPASSVAASGDPSVAPGTVALDATASSTALDRDLDGSLHLELRTPEGRPLFAALTPAQRDLAGFVRPVFTREPLHVGEDLPSGASVQVGRGTGLLNLTDANWYEYRSQVDQPAWCSAVLDDRVLATVSLRPGARRLALAISPDAMVVETGIVRCVVVSDDTYLPCAGASVALTGARNSGRFVLTNAQGVARFDDAWVGRAHLTISLAGFTTMQASVVVERGREANLGTLMLRPLASVSGWIAFPPDITIGLFVCAMRVENLGWQRGADLRVERVDPDGQFRIDGLERGEYAVGWTWTGGGEVPNDEHWIGTSRYPDWTRVDLSNGDRIDVFVEMSEQLASQMREAIAQRDASGRADDWIDTNPFRMPDEPAPRRGP